MERFTGLIGIVVILAIAFLMSNNKKSINKRLVFTGIAIQILLAIFILKVPVGQLIFSKAGYFITRILDFSNKGADFVFGILANGKKLDDVFGAGSGFIFIFKILPTIIFVSVLVSISYHIGLMQRIVAAVAKVVYKLMRVSGSEALSNVASAFVGQVEAQILIKPYISTMTMSELLASMTGSMACIEGGIMAVYISMGVPAPYLLAASLMAAPGALVIAKIVYPETVESPTKGKVQLEVKKAHSNLVDAISHGASDGLRIALNVMAMLIAFIALIAMVDAGLGYIGRQLAHVGVSLSGIGIDMTHLSLKELLGSVFSLFAWVMGVPLKDIHAAGGLLGTKIVINEFVAYSDLSVMIQSGALSVKAVTILSFALCGFANFSSVAIQVGGIGELAPERRKDLAKLGFKALICGTLASYMSATIAGIIIG